MATTATVPNAGAAGAAGNSGSASSGAAAAGSASSAANPSQQSGGAGQGSGQGDSSAAASQQGAGSPATQQEPLSTEQVIKKTLEEKLKFDDKGNITNAEEAVQHPLEKQVEKPAEAAAGAEQTVEEPKEGDAAAGEETEAAHSYESTEGIAAKDLSAKINDNPALKSALEQSPELRNQLYANARLAARVSEYEKVFMSPHEAQLAAEAHGSFSMLSGLLGQVSYDQPETANQFFRAMVEQTYLRDDDGNVLKNDKGEPRSSGAAGRFLKTMFGQRMAHDLHGLQQQLEQARQKGDDDAAESISNDLAAMERAAERLGLRAPSGADEGDIPEHIRREKATLAEQKKQLDERETQQLQQRKTQFEEAVAVDTQKVFDGEVQKFLSKATGLDDHNRATVMRNVKLALQEHLNKNGYYADEYDRIMGQAQQGGWSSAKLQQKLVGVNLKYMRSALEHHVADKALSDAGAHLAWQQKKVEETQAAREAASRGESRTALGTAKPAATMNTAQLRQQIIAEHQAAHGGEMPSQEQILREQLVRGFAVAGQR